MQESQLTNKNRKNMAVFVSFFFPISVSHRVFIACWASKYMLESKCGTFTRIKNLCNFLLFWTKNASIRKQGNIYKYGASLRGPRAYEVGQLPKKKLFLNFH